MNPFEMPPSGSPVSFEMPAHASPPPAGRNRGRMALVAVVTAGLIGGGILGVSALASADRPEAEDAASTVPDDGAPDDTAPAPDDSAPDDSAPEDSVPDDASTDDTAPDDSDHGGEDEGTDDPWMSGTIELDLGDGDPIVIDLDALDEEAVRRLTECIGLPSFDFSLDRPASPRIPNLDDLLEEFEWPEDRGEPHVIDRGSVTVAGPDGVSVIDLGESGSVTVTKDGDDISIEASGDATVSDLDELFGELGKRFDVEFPGDIGAMLERLPRGGDLPEFEPIDADAVQACIDEAFAD
jgi:hypothetical protein